MEKNKLMKNFEYFVYAIEYHIYCIDKANFILDVLKIK